ncbi:MAG: cytochrome c oxidase assembly protein subunit 15 [Glaciecola sp.]|jgi:cytochrome c oxidase assembly protein subunit 15
MLNNKFTKAYQFFTTATLVGLLIVVIAGSLVKATDSGMGCPDWPKCFGHLIPPTDPNKVNWNNSQSYFEGQMVIHDDGLWTAKSAIETKSSFNENEWELYKRHDYVIYNPTHTIIEYINRLASVLLGIFAMGMLVLSFTVKNYKKLHVSLSILTILLIGFEAWLGRLVVDSELSPTKISIHLYAAFLLVFIMTIILAYTKEKKQISTGISAVNLVGFSLLTLLVQLTLGTKLREVFDRFYNELSITRDFWIDEAGFQFLAHRSFSIVYMFLTILAISKIQKHWRENSRLKKNTQWLVVIFLLEITSGIVMSYFEVPRAAQPIHVFLSASLLCAHTYLFVDYYRSAKS